MDFIIWIVAGCLGGFLAGWFLKGDKEFNRIDVFLGILGALLGGFVLRSSGFVGTTIAAFLGAVIIVWIYEKVTGKPAL